MTLMGKNHRCTMHKSHGVGKGKEILMTEWICTACRTGCRLTVETDGESGIRVSGNHCRKGEEYGRTRMGSSANSSEGDPSAEEPVSRPDEGWSDGNDWLDRSLSSREIREIQDRMKAFGRLLKHRRRTIQPAQWRRIQSVLDGSFREIESLLND
jgi:hypothetical protein